MSLAEAVSVSAAELRLRVSRVGIFTRDDEELIIDPEPAAVGRAVAVRSGGRIAFRRVLAVDGRRLRLRADVAPFEDRWDGEILGCVRPRPIDRLIALDCARFTRAAWYAALAGARLQALQRRARPKPEALSHLSTRLLEASDWPAVRRFWKRACGDDLPTTPHARQHVLGLFDGAALVGANVLLVDRPRAYAAFTLLDRRYRGRGAGKLLIRRAVELARGEKLESIYVHVHVRNLPAMRMWRSVGFVAKGWWSDEGDPLAAAERQWKVQELDLR